MHGTSVTRTAPPPSPFTCLPPCLTYSLFVYEETMLIPAVEEFSQAVYLADEVSEPNKTAVLPSALCYSFAQTLIGCSTEG